MGIGKRIKEARENLGLTQEKLGALIGVTGSAITNYEKEVSHPKESVLYALIDALGVDANYLFQDVVNMNQPSDSAQSVARKFDRLDARARQMIETMIDAELARMKPEAKSPKIVAVADIPALKKKTRIIPLIGNGFAAGTGDPDFNVPVEDYEVPADTKADFAIKINGNSMEPYLKNGSIALATKETPKDGDIAALMVDGEFLVKQVCEDMAGNVYLFSLNRKRKDADRVLYADAEHTIDCFGTVIMEQDVPLPRE